MKRNLSARWIAMLPAAIPFAASLMLLHFLLPAARDALTESYEPIKTLRFFYSHGHLWHKWGPMPGFLFAPIYALLLLIDKLGGHLRHISSIYPFGLDNPVQELGNMIFAARIMTLLAALAGIYYLTRVLQRALKSTTGPVLAVLLSLSTSMVFLESLVDTKPDGLMLAFLLFALANYAAIVLEGLTRRRVIGLAFFWVASLSCKELTAITMVLPCLGLITLALASFRGDTAAGKRKLKVIAIASLCVIGFYVLINVIYAPDAWLERLHYVLGPLKDPSIWAGAHQTRADYLLASVMAVLGSIGWGGVVLLLIALAGSIRYPSWPLLMLWLPFVSHFVLAVTTAGYMPAYFMLPEGPALCLPGSYVVCTFVEQKRVQGRELTLVTAMVAVCCTWVAFCATTVFRCSHFLSMTDTAFKNDIPSGATVSMALIFPGRSNARTSGPDQTTIDQRPIFEIMTEDKTKRPGYLLVSSDEKDWVEEIKDRPARAAMLKVQTGADYSTFRGFEQLGYELKDTISPHYPAWCSHYVVADSQPLLNNHLLIYRLSSDSLDNSTVTSAIQAAGR